MNRSETICSLQRIKNEEEKKKREKVKLEKLEVSSKQIPILNQSTFFTCLKSGGCKLRKSTFMMFN